MDKKRISKYISMVEKTLKYLEENEKKVENFKELFEVAKTYLLDAKQYLKEGKYFEALSCISYAEGLIDSLRFLNLLNFEWIK